MCFCRIMFFFLLVDLPIQIHHRAPEPGPLPPPPTTHAIRLDPTRPTLIRKSFPRNWPSYLIDQTSAAAASAAPIEAGLLATISKRLPPSSSSSSSSSPSSS